MKIIPFSSLQVRCLSQLKIALLLSFCVALPGQAAQHAYYSTGQNVTSAGSGDVSLATTTEAA
ncbi:MAG: hypothetical protein EOO62_13195 [Hymenobacter sp.]|nr:MAG: hypothetical protein EOO62_13195 [Hymenobacter sp.]